MRRLVAGCVAVACALVMIPGTALAATSVTLVVDDDRVQCGDADFGTIAGAVAAAKPGDTVRVCPGVYRERVDITKRLHLIGRQEAVDRVRCIDESWTAADAVDPAVLPIVEPPDGAVGSLLRLQADGVEVAGFVVQGQSDLRETDIYAPAIQADGANAGHRVHHNLIQNNTLGVELGSNGSALSQVDHNCLRGNGWAVANQRYATRNVRVDHNETSMTRYIPFEILGPTGGSSGPQYVRDARYDHNRTVGSGFAAYLVQRAQRVGLDHNTVEGAAEGGVDIRGGITDITVTDNRLSGTATNTAGVGVGVLAPFPDAPEPSVGVVIAKNVVTSFAYGVRLGLNAQTSGVQILDNVTQRNRLVGILIGRTNTEALVQGNVADNNGVYGIATGSPPVRGNVILRNSMHGNTTLDALEATVESHPDGSVTLGNTWQGNRCTTDSPVNTICGK